VAEAQARDRALVAKVRLSPEPAASLAEAGVLRRDSDPSPLLRLSHSHRVDHLGLLLRPIGIEPVFQLATIVGSDFDYAATN
jgi:hypothetical protein